MVGDHSEEAGGVSLDCAGSAQNCDSFAGSAQFGSSSANSKDCETDSVSELTVAVPQKRPGASVCRHAGQYGICRRAKRGGDHEPPGARQTSKDSGE